jgi:hypothetical protein
LICQTVVDESILLLQNRPTRLLLRPEVRGF